MRNTTINRTLLLGIIHEAVSKDPSLVSEIIDAATEGVKKFAKEQKDIGSQAAFRLFSVLETIEIPEDKMFGPFTLEEVLQPVETWFGGTEGLLRLKYSSGLTKDLMDCTICGKIKHLNEFETPDVCTECFKTKEEEK